MKRLVLVATLVLGTIACDKTVATAPNTTLIDLPTVSKLSVTDWTAGSPKGPLTRVEKTYRFEPGGTGSTVRFKLTFEHGPVELVTDKPAADKPESFLAPRAVKIVVVENPAWSMSAKCDDVLSVPLAVKPDGSSAYPKSVWLHCSVILKRKNGDITVAPWIDLHGTGEIKLNALSPEQKLVAE